MLPKLRLALVIGLAVAAVLLVSCGERETPTPTPVPPTMTPVPPTPTPTPIPLSSIVDDAYAAMVRSDFAGAIELFEQVAAAEPTYADAYVGLSTAYYWMLGEEPRALEQAKKAVALAPESAQAYAALARAYGSMTNAPEALQAARKAAELDPSSADTQAVLSMSHLWDRDYPAALEAAERALELQPDSVAAYQALGRYYWVTGDAARAQAAYEHAVAQQPEFAPWYVLLGSLILDTGRSDRAKAEYGRALELMPESLDAKMGLAYLAMDRGDYASAEALIDEVANALPEAPEPYQARSALYRYQEENDEAHAQLRLALSKRESLPAAIQGEGWIYLNDGECDLAVRQFQTLMADQPRSADGLVGMGFARLCDGDPVKALEYLRKAIKLDPYEEWGFIGLGIAYGAQERWEEANQAFAEALKVGLLDAEAHRGLGAGLFDQGDNEAAQAEFELALRLNPEMVDNAPAYIQLAYLAMSDGDLDLAEGFGREALRLNPKDTEAQFVLGVVLVEQGKNDEASTILTDLIEKEPEHAYAHYFLGLAYKGEQRFEEAKDALETFTALDESYESDYRLSALVEALDQGYFLAETKALSDIAKDVEDTVEREAAVEIADIADFGRTMVITLTADPEQEPEEVYTDMVVATARASAYLPRVEPAVEGGLQVRLVDGGQVQFTLSEDLRTATQFADSLLGGTEYVTALEFRRSTPNAAEATVDEIKANVSSTRELSPTTDVPYQVLTEEELRTHYENDLDEGDRSDLQDDQAFLTLLGVISPTVDLEKLLLDLSAEQVSGFYSPKEQVFYLVERGETTASDQMTMAHEYVHALQDQNYDLDVLRERSANSDEQVAISALIEGDATLAMLQYGEEHVILYDRMQSISEAGGIEGETLDSSPAFIRENEIFPYVNGMDFVMTLYDRGGWDAVNDAYQKLPRSSEQILHPERYRRGDDPVEVELPDVAGSLSGDWQEVDRDVMGEIGLRLYLQEHVGPAVATLAAEGWGGDTYTLLRNGDQEQYLLVLLTEWDDQEEADQFWALYRVAMSHRVDYTEEVAALVGDPESMLWRSDAATTYARQDGKRVLIIVGPDAETVEAAADVWDAETGAELWSGMAATLWWEEPPASDE